MPETRTVKGFSEVLLPFAEGDFESGPLTSSIPVHILFSVKARTNADNFFIRT